jgi:hypothetical protein
VLLLTLGQCPPSHLHSCRTLCGLRLPGLKLRRWRIQGGLETAPVTAEAFLQCMWTVWLSCSSHASRSALLAHAVSWYAYNCLQLRLQHQLSTAAAACCGHMHVTGCGCMHGGGACCLQVRARFETDGPELFDDKRCPRRNWMVPGTLRDASGSLPMVVNPEFLEASGATLYLHVLCNCPACIGASSTQLWLLVTVHSPIDLCSRHSGCGQGPSDLMRQMREYVETGKKEMDAPRFKTLDTIVSFVEEPCLLLVEQATSEGYNFQFSIADSRFRLPNG